MSELQKGKLYTIAEIETTNERPRPEFIGLPSKGPCPWTSLGRSTLYRLISPSKENGWNPPVKSICLRATGTAKGRRLIHYQSLIDYLHSLPADFGTGEEE